MVGTVVIKYPSTMPAATLGDAPPVAAGALPPDAFGTPLPEVIATPPDNPAAPAWNAAYSAYAAVKANALPVSSPSSSVGSSTTGSVSE